MQGYRVIYEQSQAESFRRVRFGKGVDRLKHVFDLEIGWVRVEGQGSSITTLPDPALDHTTMSAQETHVHHSTVLMMMQTMWLNFSIH